MTATNTKRKTKQNYKCIIIFVLVIAYLVFSCYQITTLNNKLLQMQENVQLITTTNAQQNQAISSQKQQIIAINNQIDQQLGKTNGAFQVQMASYQLDFFHNTTKAISWLKRAASSTNSSSIKEEINQAIAQISTQVNYNIAAQLATLTKLQQKIYGLELGNSLTKVSVTTEKSSTNILANFFNKFIVVSTDSDNNGRVWLNPTQKTMLITDLGNLIAQAKWASMYHNNEVYQTSLDGAYKLLDQYFKHVANKEILQQIHKLQNLDVSPKTLDFSGIILKLSHDVSSNIEPKATNEENAKQYASNPTTINVITEEL